VEGRYYQWLVPLMMLCVLVAAAPHCEKILGHAREAIISVIVLGFFVASVGYSIYLNHIESTINNDVKATHEKLLSINSVGVATSIVVFADSRNYPTLVWRERRINTYNNLAWLTEDTHFSHETMVALVCSRKDPRYSAKGINRCVTEGFDSMAQKYAFNKLSAGTYNTLYWKVFPKDIQN
jgi:hypothetical protein